ncbi:MAG: SRPBCC family protein [Parasphingopyxis sp.]|uniref:SRPBCC family protein n=1 Tax=Parasphingopyxis sp. TaxID=1920299 RepID=UPI003FA0710F
MTTEQPIELSVTRHIAAPVETVWKIMTERMEEWWCPKPWRMEIIEWDFRPGGRTAMVMKGPDGEEFPGDGIFLDVTPNRRFASTDAITASLVPQEPFMIGIWEIEPEDGGTRYTGRARHWTEDGKKRHEEMGFEEGWNTVADQLATLCEKMGVDA